MSPAPLREIVNLVAFATRPRYVLVDDTLQRTRRPSPSAGALQPIEMVIVDWRGMPRVLHYDSLAHQIDVLIPRASGALHALQQMVREMLPDAQGTGLVLLGNGTRIAAAYDNPASLLWRDSGALLQTLCLAAAAFRLAFCPLGILGHEVLKALALPPDVCAVGAAIVGRSTEAPPDFRRKL